MQFYRHLAIKLKTVGDEKKEFIIDGRYGGLAVAVLQGAPNMPLPEKRKDIAVSERMALIS
jgi:hypothetical protein